MSKAIVAICFLACVAITLVEARGLYGLIYPPQLVGIDITTGQFKTIGGAITNEGMAQELTTIDNIGTTFYFIGYNFTTSKANLIGVSTKTGAVTNKFVLPFTESDFVGVGQAIDFDANTGDIIATGRLTATGPHSVMRVNPKTGAYKVVGSVDGGDVLGSSTAFNPITSVEYLQYATNDTVTAFQRRMSRRAIDMPAMMTPPNRVSIDLYGVDLKSGAVDHIIEDSSMGKVLTTLQYDPKTKTLIGLGYKNNGGTFQRTIERYDPVGRVWNTVREVNDFLVESGGVSALDVQGRVLYAIMQKPNVPQSDPFYLVGFNADTGATVSSSILCQQFPDCPWSLEFAQ